MARAPTNEEINKIKNNCSKHWVVDEPALGVAFREGMRVAERTALANLTVLFAGVLVDGGQHKTDQPQGI